MSKHWEVHIINDDRNIISCDNDESIKIWDKDSGNLI
jgi:hypothetical protein